MSHCALLSTFKEMSVRQARAVATLCPFVNKKRGEAAFVSTSGAKGKKFTHDTTP